MRKFVLLMSAVLFCAFSAMGQTQRVTGTVTDTSGSPVAGATVIVAGTQQGVVTQSDGSFSINAPANGALQVSFLGFVPVEVEINNRTTINIQMEMDAQRIDDVMVVAYGTARKESYTGSAGVISAKQIEKRTVSNITKALEGTTPGLMLTSGTGQPGDGATIRVRGFGSLNSSNDPLIVVDGAAYGGTLSSINPDDIASITVLKDASAGALYGARGANGVVLINTKRGLGSDGKTRVSLKANWGLSSRAVPNYDFLDEKDFIEQNFIIYRNAALFTNGIDPANAGEYALNEMLYGGSRLFGTNQQYIPYNVSSPTELLDPATGKLNPNLTQLWSQSWLDEALRSTAVRQNYNASVSGGNQNTQYYSSLGYTNEQGVMKTTSFERVSANVSVDTKITDWLKFSGALNYSVADQNYQGGGGSTGYGNPWYAAQGMASIYPVYEMDRNGNYILDDNGKRIYDWSDDRPAGASPNFNAVGLLFDDAYYVKNESVRLNGSLHVGLNDARYGWAEGFFASTNFAGDVRNLRQTEYYNPYFGNASGETGGRLTKLANRNWDFTFNQIFGYNRTFNGHNIFGQVGHEFFERTYNYLGATKTGFPFGGIHELNPGVDLSAINSYQHKYAVESVFGQLKYSYMDKYNFDVSFRTDGSSRFHKDHRWGNFWSVGANWRISEEDFMRPVNWVNNLSLRTSYGVQGNDQLLSGTSAVYYAWQSFYNLSYGNASNNAAYISSLENSTISWEQSHSFNVGLEGRLLNRVNLTVEYYNKTTKDMLLNVPMALSTGFESYDDNIGDMRNQGIEYSVSVDIFQNPNFRWRLTTIGTHNKNEILKLASDTPIVDGNYVIQVGKSYRTYLLPESAGVDPATGNKLYYAWSQMDENTNQPAKDAFRYVTDDPNAASNSRIAKYNPFPKLEGSVGSEFVIYKNIDFSFLATFGIGGKALDGQYWTYINPSSPGQTLHKNVKRAWQKPGDITDIPRVDYDATYRVTSDQLLSRSYFSLKNITIGYSFQGALAKRMGIESFRIYAAGDNLFILSALKGFNPTSSYGSSSNYTYMPIRTISMGVNLNF